VMQAAQVALRVAWAQPSAAIALEAALHPARASLQMLRGDEQAKRR
jgi:hypothetical protein